MGKRSRRRKQKRQKKALVCVTGGAAKVEKGSTWEDNTEINSADDFKLIIPEAVFQKVMYWINKASPDEVSGFGHLEFDANKRIFKVTDAILLKQEVSGGSAEIDDQAIAKAMFENKDNPGALKWHWHSHPTFGVQWSGTDMNLIRQLGQQGWIVATVINCKRESRTAFLTTVDLLGQPHDIFVDDFPMEIESLPDLELLNAYDAEFDAKVEKKKWGTNSAWVSKYRPEGEKSHPINNWEPSGYTAPIPKDSYNNFGYTTWQGRTVYNPLRDNEVTTVALLYAMISDMSQFEIDYLSERDFEFKTAAREFMVAKACETDSFDEEKQ